MVQFNEQNNSILYINNNKILIEKNILSNKKYIRYYKFDIFGFYINVQNMIIAIDNGCKIVVMDRNAIIREIMYGDWVHLIPKIRGSLCITMRSVFEIYNSGKLSKEIPMDWKHYTISEDITRIAIYYPRIFDQDQVLYVKNITYAETIFDFDDVVSFIPIDNISRKYDLLLDISLIFWISNSSRVVIIYFYHGNKVLLINIENGSTMVVDVGSYLYIMDVDKYLVLFFVGYAEFYDINSFVVLGKIDCNLIFLSYSRKFGLLLSNSFEYYRINSCYGFEKIVMGRNYIRDRNHIDNRVMDILLSDDLLFVLLPNEIIFVEFYQCILKIVDNF